MNLFSSAIATLKEGATCPTERLEKMGIQVRYIFGDMVALFIPADKLHLLEDMEEFSFVRADEYCHIMNDEARKDTGVDKINTAAAATAEGLPQAYTGKGIVLGIIDRGIDFNHAAFRNADGTTRIKKAVHDRGTNQGIDHRLHLDFAWHSHIEHGWWLRLGKRKTRHGTRGRTRTGRPWDKHLQ